MPVEQIERTDTYGTRYARRFKWTFLVVLFLQLLAWGGVALSRFQSPDAGELNLASGMVDLAAGLVMIAIAAAVLGLIVNLVIAIPPSGPAPDPIKPVEPGPDPLGPMDNW